MKYTFYMIDGPSFDVEAESEEEAHRKAKEEANRRANTFPADPTNIIDPSGELQ